MTDLLGKVIDLASLVDFQTGSVVSRTIIKKKTGTVTVFAFEKGEGLSEHTAPFDAMALIVDGEAEITVAGKTLPTRAGEMVILPANKPHALKAQSRFKMILVMIRE